MRGQTQRLNLQPALRRSALKVSVVDQKGNDLKAKVYSGERQLGRARKTIKLPLCSEDLHVRHRTFGREDVTVQLKEEQVTTTTVTVYRAELDTQATPSQKGPRTRKDIAREKALAEAEAIEAAILNDMAADWGVDAEADGSLNWPIRVMLRPWMGGAGRL